LNKGTELDRDRNQRMNSTVSHRDDFIGVHHNVVTAAICVGTVNKSANKRMLEPKRTNANPGQL
jgi:hypothetical protein